MSETTSVVKFTDDNLDSYINSDKPVMVDFWASWCGPCKMIAPIVEDLATEFGDQAAVGKMNVEENTSGTKFGVLALPTIMVFKNGEKVESITGVASKAKLKQALEKHL